MNTGKHILFFIVVLIFTLGGDILLDNWHYKEGDHRRLQKEFNKKYSQADRLFNRLQSNNWALETELPDKKGIVFLVYRNDSLVYWSDNSLLSGFIDQKTLRNKRFDFISNGWFVIKPYLTDSISAFALILVKTQYPYENNFLVNQFQPDLKLPVSTELLSEAQPGSYAILDWEGIYLFSIRFSMHELRFAKIERYLIPLLIIVTALAFFMLIHSIIENSSRARTKNAIILILPVFFIFFRWFQIKYQFPADLYQLEMFGPIPFAKSQYLPSLGDLFLNTFVLLFIIIEFYLGFKLPERVFKRQRTGSTLTIFILIMLLTGFFLYSHYIISTLILHSIISFEFYKAVGLSVYTLVGLVILVMHFAGFLFIANKMLIICKLRCRLKNLIMMFLFVCALAFFILYILHYRIDAGSFLSYFVLFITLAILQYKKIPLGNYSAMALMVVMFSVYSVYLISKNENTRTENNMAVMAENLSAQHDPIAEYLLEDISDRLTRDEILKTYIFNLNISDEQIHNYLQSNYFNGFWNKYMLLYSDCSPNYQDYFNDTLTNCYDYYNARLYEGKRMQLPRTKFYFLDSQNGRINYLGWIVYQRPDGKGERSLFIELESRLVSEELGFPDLLLDKRYQKNKLLEAYSYAKYYKNQLLAQSGAFQYSLDLSTYRNKPTTFGRYKHYIYNVNKDSVVIVSKPTVTFFNKLVSFSYIFIFYYVIVLLFIVLRDFSKLGKDIQFNFKNRIQFSITALIFLSLFLVGGGTIYFSMQQYQNKQHDILSEKIQSVYIELDHLLAYFPERIPPDWKGDGYDNLNQLLIKFSDVFYSDINLYDPQGNLLASSRPELFANKITGEKMDPVAYSKMVEGKQAEFINRERIGNLRYISAYVPFVNALDNKLLAYINLPYFTRQNILRNEVTTLVVAIVNVYVLLILVTIAMAAFISEQITRPLRMIQQKFSQIKLGKKNEEIVYKGHDEIAGLVDEYNKMVRELMKSVEMLARSERESAWREMAKQVAHEIKNPLTPMKLSVQHLQRSWNDNPENFDEYLQKVTRTLIEQIDNLSFIASEFSNFAKMPKANNEVINIVAIAKSAINLFSNTENVDFVIEHESDHIPVFADKEQISRVFINLIKNAIQSIPDNRSGKIGFSLVLNRDGVSISVTDNGKGIPEELQSKLFTPSFTTKSSGMGLGLSIVKNIIESLGGTIHFNTKVNHGTTFLIELPVYHPESLT